jgi:hypothetical protein
MNVKGYKTAITFVIVMIAGVFGRHLPPEIVQAYASDAVEVIGIVFMGLRLFTDSPFGQKEIGKIEAVGVPKEWVDQIIAQLPPQADLTSLLEAVKNLHDKVEAIPVNVPSIAVSSETIPVATVAQAPGV